MLLVFCLAACGVNHADSSPNNTDNTPAVNFGLGAEDVPTTVPGESLSHILIAYFSVPEDVDTSGVDAVAGASIVVKDGQVMGNTEYIAGIIQQTIGSDLFRIETIEQYPLTHDWLNRQHKNRMKMPDRSLPRMLRTRNNMTLSF